MMTQTPKHKLVLEVPGGAKRVLLHTCCAPCSSAIIEIMLQQGITPTIFYSNSNIFPQEEYLHRKDECTRYAQSLGLEIVDDDYVHEDWRRCAAAGLENEPERGARCLACFKYRLLRAASYASEHGYTVLATTLASSRWKDLRQVDEAGLWACSQVTSSLPSTSVLPSSASPSAVSPVILSAAKDLPTSPATPVSDTPVTQSVPTAVTWWGQNWRKGGLQNRRNQLIRELGFYNQQYCGCEYSLRPDPQ